MRTSCASHIPLFLIPPHRMSGLDMQYLIWKWGVVFTDIVSQSFFAISFVSVHKPATLLLLYNIHFSTILLVYVCTSWRPCDIIHPALTPLVVISLPGRLLSGVVLRQLQLLLLCLPLARCCCVVQDAAHHHPIGHAQRQTGEELLSSRHHTTLHYIALHCTARHHTTPSMAAAMDTQYREMNGFRHRPSVIVFIAFQWYTTQNKFNAYPDI